jgi:nicotinamide phosphoribosyltransferase
MWEHILKEHNGYLPVRIKAVPEGSVIPNSNVLMTVVNTDPACWALPNHLETILTHTWYPSTVATLSRETKRVILPHMERTMDAEAVKKALLYMLHDFGFRGATCVEAAGIGGAAHLLNFLGTDTLPALDILEDYYDSPNAGVSVPATEHSIMTAGGLTQEGEERVVRHLLDQHPTGPLSIVGDSRDIYNFCENIIGGTFRDRILKRNGVIIPRPDSDDPLDVMPRCLSLLASKFGAHENKQGFLELPPQVKLLWGDGLDLEMIDKICLHVTQRNWSMSNIATFGMGGGLLQRVHRDTQRKAFKCSAQCQDGIWRDIWKDPIDKSKASKRGRLDLVKVNDEYKTLTEAEAFKQGLRSEMNTVFETGNILKRFKIDEMRDRAKL